MSPATQKKREYEATDPKRVWDKLRDCNEILREMAKHQDEKDTDRLMRSLSALLSEFRTTANRLTGVVKTQQGEVAKAKLWTQLKAHPEIGFLIDRANCETHGDGAVVWPRYRMDIPCPVPERWSSNLSAPRLGSRFHSNRSKWPVPPRLTVTEVKDWRFQQRSENIVALCSYALNELENIIRQALR